MSSNHRILNDDQKHFPQYTRLIRYVVKSFINSLSQNDVIKDILKQIQITTDIECVAIRLKSHHDFPYLGYHGFPLHLITRENRVCTVDSEGKPVLDTHGKPVLECMCGIVLSQKTDRTKPFFTQKGSFWTNCTTNFFATISPSDLPSTIRNQCLNEGYESIALIPLLIDNQPIGLLQLSDRRSQRFTTDLLHEFEDVSDVISAILKHHLTQHELHSKEERFQAFIQNSEVGYFFLDCECRFKQVNDTWLALHGYSSAQEVIGHHINLTHHDQNPEKMPYDWKSIIETGTPLTGEFGRKLKNGLLCFHRLCAWPVINNNTVVGIEGFVIDTTEAKNQREEIMKKNIALEQILSAIRNEKAKLEDAISANVEKILLPLLQKLSLDSTVTGYTKLLEQSIKELSSSFSKHLSSLKATRLTAKELEICTMIRAGMKNKEISRLQGTAISTVETERKIIRKKLGITNKKTNLPEFLKQMN